MCPHGEMSLDSISETAYKRTHILIILRTALIKICPKYTEYYGDGTSDNGFCSSALSSALEMVDDWTRSPSFLHLQDQATPYMHNVYIWGEKNTAMVTKNHEAFSLV